MTSDLSDLSGHLFAQLDRLSNDGLSKEELDQEVDRAKAIVAVSDQITGVADVKLKAAKIMADHGMHMRRFLPDTGVKPLKAIDGGKSE